MSREADSIARCFRTDLLHEVGESMLVPPIAAEYRLILWLVVNVCSLVPGIMLAMTGEYLNYWLRRYLFREARVVEPPAVPATAAWVILFVAALGTVVGTAWAEAAPEGGLPVAESLPG